MEAWEKQPLIEQEKSLVDINLMMELTDEEKRARFTQVVTNIQDENGEDLKIVRANMPFSNPSKK